MTESGLVWLNLSSNGTPSKTQIKFILQSITGRSTHLHIERSRVQFPQLLKRQKTCFFIPRKYSSDLDQSILAIIPRTNFIFGQTRKSNSDRIRTKFISAQPKKKTILTELGQNLLLGQIFVFGQTQKLSKLAKPIRTEF